MKPTPDPVRVFTEAEKRELAGRSFRDLVLDGVDFSGADLHRTVFERVSLRGCDFRRADLRGAEVLGCDLAGARFDETLIGNNRFHGSTLGEVSGLTEEQLDYVGRRGGDVVARSSPRLSLVE